jgi:hypothetical protein
MEESRKSSRGFRKKPSNCQRNTRNLQISSKWEVCLTSTAFNTDMKTSRSIVCQTNMHLIMRIENAFKFCGKLIHFYNERISFLFYCEDGKRGAVSWLSLNAVEVKQTSTLKGSVTGNTDLDNYILCSRVAPDTTDADVHALCTKPVVFTYSVCVYQI